VYFLFQDLHYLHIERTVDSLAHHHTFCDIIWDFHVSLKQRRRSNTSNRISQQYGLLKPLEPEFVNVLRSPGIDSKIRAVTTNRVIKPAHQATWAVGIGSMESILVLLKLTRALVFFYSPATKHEFTSVTYDIKGEFQYQSHLKPTLLLY
jgi:hypothetical protein